MYRLLPVFSITLGLFAVSVASAQQNKDEFMNFPDVKVKSIDFQQVLEGQTDKTDELLIPPAPEPELAGHVEEIDKGLIVDDSSQLPAVTVTETVAACPEPCSQSCRQCRQTRPCACEPKGKIRRCMEDYWHSTCIYRKHAQNLGDPCLFCERPLGVCRDSWFGAMITSGKVDRAVLHDYDFAHYADGVVTLTERGQHDLRRIAVIVSEFPVPLTIESTNHPSLDAARRLAVANAIAELNLPVSPANIRISRDQAIGLSGEDALIVEKIRISEMATGASRSRPYRDSAGATIIPMISGDNSDR